MTNEQRSQQPAPHQDVPPQRVPAPRTEFAKKGTLAAIGGAVSGTARAL